MHSLVLGGWCDILVYRQMREEDFDFGFGREQILPGAHLVKMSEPGNPVHIGSLGVDGIVVKTEHLSDFLQEFGRLTFGDGRHRILLQNKCVVGVDNRIGQECPKT
jgi:hypothetical protein